MRIKLSLVLLSVLSASLFLSCEKAEVPDYTTPFYKVYEGAADGKKYIIHLYRLPPTDTFEGPMYGGSMYDADEQVPLQFQTYAPDSLPNRFTIGGGQQGFSLEINGAASELKGQMLRYSNGAGSSVTDSAAFTAKEVEAPLAFAHSGAAGTHIYDTTRETSPEYRYEFSVLLPQMKDSAVGKILKHTIFKFFGLADSTRQPAKTLVENGMKEFAEGFDDLDGEDREFILGMATSGKMDSKFSEVVFAGKRWLSLSFSETYEGGAHSQTDVRYTAYDLLTGNKLQLSDVLTKRGQSKLTRLLAESIRAQYNLGPRAPLTEAGLFENRISANDNFYVTEKGVGFFYNNYEIASFAAGSYNVFIPFRRFEAGDVTPLFAPADA